jgi:hypothetical protein
VTGRPLGQLIILLAQVVRRAGRPERVQRLRGARANEGRLLYGTARGILSVLANGNAVIPCTETANEPGACS